ncbi:hypothetical protein L1987_72779 [Smallanthus sonchifolius]|uniref:Uncharacterized protein n=1 Tax=Smallanthus sonchifolius TaxID=185202 RepID=A0ACB9AVR6_9ASTR|nr:hypothetical protein L1987_72779 [Smallanthus sonchifolius]
MFSANFLLILKYCDEQASDWLHDVKKSSSMDFSSQSSRSPRFYNHTRKNSASAVHDSHHENLPILSDHDASTSHSVDHREFIVKIDCEDRDKEGNSVTGFRRDILDGMEDLPSKLIGEFLNKQKDFVEEMTLDMDELRHNSGNAVNQKLPNSPFKGDQHSESSSDEDDIRSLEQHQLRRKSSNLNSLSRVSEDKGAGILARGENEEEDDSLFEEDNPDDFKREKLNALTLIQWISLILIMYALICTLSIHNWKRKAVRGLHIWEWEVLVLVLICGRLVSGWGIRFVVFFIERNFLLRKRVLYFVYGIRKPVQNCIWLGLVLIAWHYMFDEKVEGHNRFLRVVNKLMVCMLVATSLWLVKTLMVKVLTSSFHVKKFFDRIQEALFNQYVIETLSPLVEIQNNQIEEEKTIAEVNKLQSAGANMPPELGEKVFPTKSERVIGSGRSQKPPPVALKIDEKELDHLHRLNPKNISALNMKRLMRIVRNGTLSTLDEQLHDMNSQEDDSVTQIRSEIEA